MSDDSKEWTLVIKPKSSWFQLNLDDLWRYRDLIYMFVKRDFVSQYKQTILGPLWFLIQPILTTITYTIIFGGIANISTGEIPMPLFYMAGITMWNYFAGCLNKTADTFVANASIFGKVYFPRLTVPISSVLSGLVAFFIQMGLLAAVYIFYYAYKDANIHVTYHIFLLPLLIIIMALLGLGTGIIVSSLTTKYRDLKFLVSFGVQLLMYAAPVVYPMSSISPAYRPYVVLNPMTGIIETFKYSVFGSGTFEWWYLGYSALFTVIVLFTGVILFNKVEKTFMDTV